MCYQNNNNNNDNDRENDNAHNDNAHNEAVRNYERIRDDLDFRIRFLAPIMQDVFVEIDTPNVSEDEGGLSDSDSDSEVEDDPGIYYSIILFKNTILLLYYI